MPGRGRKRNRERDSVGTPKQSKRHKIHHRSHSNSGGGLVLTCGEGDVGQLGLGEDIMEKSRPGLVRLDEKVVQVCAGGMHTVCLTTDGEIYTFGCNDEGALGRDTSEEGSETLPAKIKLPAKVVQVSAGDSHTAALSEEGRVFIWGNFRDANGSIGLTVEGGIQTTPLEVLNDETVVKIASGGDHLACLTDKGALYTFGCAEQGQLGRVAECFSQRGGRKGLSYILNPDVVRCKRYKSKKLAEFSDVWAGQYMTFALEKNTGEVYGWGLNNYYQLGFSDMENRFMPERVTSFSSDKEWTCIDGGQHHTVALDSDGKVYCMGRGEYGRLGLGDDTKEKSQPTTLPGLGKEKYSHIAAGQCVSFAIRNDGTAFGWGMGTSKQLATGDEEDVLEPTQPAGKQLENRKVLMISSGGQHTVFLVEDKANS